MNENKWLREGDFTSSPELFKFLSSVSLAFIFITVGLFGISVVGVSLAVLLIIPCWLFLEQAWKLEDIDSDINSELKRYHLVQSISRNPTFEFDEFGDLVSVTVGKIVYQSAEGEIYRSHFGAGVYLTIIYLPNGKHVAVVTEGDRSTIFESYESN